MTRTSWPTLAAVLLAGAALSAQAPAPAPPAQPPADPAAQTAPPPPLPQDTSDQPPITFRAEVNYVEVDARVVDAQGRVRPWSRRGRLRGLRGRQAAEGRRLLAGQHPGRASGPAALRQGADRARRRGQPHRLRRPDLRAAARRHPDQRAAQPAHQGGGARLRAALHRRQRHRRGGLHRRPLRRRAGVHQQPGPAAGRHRQVHGPQDSLGHARTGSRPSSSPARPASPANGSPTSSTRSGR